MYRFSIIKRAALILITLIFVASCTQDEDVAQSSINDKEKKEFLDLLYSNDEFNEVLAQLEKQMTDEEKTMASIDELNQTANNARMATSDEPFVFFVIGDSELSMRGNTYEQLENWINKINDVESLDLEFVSGNFEVDESKKITKPEMVFLAGDINKDRSFGPGTENWEINRNTRQLFDLLDSDILFFPGHGNHDWDPYEWDPGVYGHNLGGLVSNLGTVDFIRNRYHQSVKKTNQVGNRSITFPRNTTWLPLVTSADFHYSFSYKGLQFSVLNNFIHQPIAMVNFESLFATGPATYFPTKALPWFQKICDASSAAERQHVVVQHYPINTSDRWWNDYLGGTPDGLRKSFLDIFEDSHEPVMFSGHQHFRVTTNVMPYGIKDYTSGYFATGHITAVKASASKGIYAVAYVRLDNSTVSDPSNFNRTYTVDQ